MAAKADPYAGIDFDEINEATGGGCIIYHILYINMKYSIFFTINMELYLYLFLSIGA